MQQSIDHGARPSRSTSVFAKFLPDKSRTFMLSYFAVCQMVDNSYTSVSAWLEDRKRVVHVAEKNPFVPATATFSARNSTQPGRSMLAGYWPLSVTWPLSYIMLNSFIRLALVRHRLRYCTFGRRQRALAQPVSKPNNWYRGTHRLWRCRYEHYSHYGVAGTTDDVANLRSQSHYAYRKQITKKIQQYRGTTLLNILLVSVLEKEE